MFVALVFSANAEAKGLVVLGRGLSGVVSGLGASLLLDTAEGGSGNIHTSATTGLRIVDRWGQGRHILLEIRF